MFSLSTTSSAAPMIDSLVPSAATTSSATPSATPMIDSLGGYGILPILPSTNPLADKFEIFLALYYTLMREYKKLKKATLAARGRRTGQIRLNRKMKEIADLLSEFLIQAKAKIGLPIDPHADLSIHSLNPAILWLDGKVRLLSDQLNHARGIRGCYHQLHLKFDDIRKTADEIVHFLLEDEF